MLLVPFSKTCNLIIDLTFKVLLFIEGNSTSPSTESTTTEPGQSTSTPSSTSSPGSFSITWLWID